MKRRAVEPAKRVKILPVHTKFLEDRYSHSSNIKALPQQFERL
jgi:hypothetical protein